MLAAKTFKVTNDYSIAVEIYSDLVIVTLPKTKNKVKAHTFPDEASAAFWLHDTFGVDMYGD